VPLAEGVEGEDGGERTAGPRRCWAAHAACATCVNAGRAAGGATEAGDRGRVHVGDAAGEGLAEVHRRDAWGW
jgi:hypothetical protein